jgi:CheY-like chemotaxis protein
MEFKRILLGDDDDDDCLLIKSAFADLKINAKIDVVHDGAAVIQHLYSQSDLPDVVYLDVNLPVLNGFDCVNIIRNDSRLYRLPVIIATTAYTAVFDYAVIKHADLLHLRKPNSYQKLISEIEQSLKLASLRTIRHI